MAKIDIVKLRKFAGLSQRELADKLQVRPSFLSAIENGKSRLPEEKIEKLKKIFDLDNFDGFIIDDKEDLSSMPLANNYGDEGNAIARILQHFHAQAHQMEGQSSREEILEKRIDFLSERNDRLSSRVDQLREEIDSLKDENYRLKILLSQNGIQF